MLAHRQRALLKAAEMARNLAVDGKTVARILDLLVNLLPVRRMTGHIVDRARTDEPAHAEACRLA